LPLQPADAMEDIRYSDMHPAMEDVLNFGILGRVPAGTKIGH
jgi:hypothetical protein